MAKKKETIPQHELEALAATLYPAIVEFFESEQGQKEFELWKQQQNIKESNQNEYF